ncbi:MAG: hypothetical protein KF753_23455 [Caldilineaceae bacterium]|nr:hypothetical protein [Caldilineaceae bacterium]
MPYNKLRLLELSGSPYAMGYAHGLAYRDDIRRYTLDRVALAGSPGWTGGLGMDRAGVMALAEACVAEHEIYAPDLMEEVRGTADATGLRVAELVITNGFTDFVDLVYAQAHQREATPLAADDCTAFIVPDSRAADGHGFFGQTWDMHDDSTEFVILLRGKPDGGPGYLAFSITGCVGMIGMNDAGIAIGINNLLGGDGQVGVTWPFVVRKALQQTDIDAALACITEAKLSGAHNYLLFDGKGNGYNVEAMSTHCAVTALDGEPLLHTNHCLLPEAIARSRPRAAASQAASEARLAEAQAYLSDGAVSADDLIELTRRAPVCVRSVPPLHIESCGAALMRPATGDFWAVWGPPADGEYEHFRL